MGDTTPIPLHVLQIASVLPSAVALGYAVALSKATASLIDASPKVSVPIFAAFSRSSALLMKSLPLVSTLASAYLAYMIPSRRTIWAITAATVSLGTVVTAGISGPAAKKLAGMEKDASEHTLLVRDLMMRCIRGNYIRSFALAIGSMAGMLACIEG